MVRWVGLWLKLKSLGRYLQEQGWWPLVYFKGSWLFYESWMHTPESPNWRAFFGRFPTTEFDWVWFTTMPEPSVVSSPGHHTWTCFSLGWNYSLPWVTACHSTIMHVCEIISLQEGCFPWVWSAALSNSRKRCGVWFHVFCLEAHVNTLSPFSSWNVIGVELNSGWELAITKIGRKVPEWVIQKTKLNKKTCYKLPTGHLNIEINHPEIKLCTSLNKRPYPIYIYL